MLFIYKVQIDVGANQNATRNEILFSIIYIKEFTVLGDKKRDLSPS